MMIRYIICYELDPKVEIMVKSLNAMCNAGTNVRWEYSGLKYLNERILYNQLMAEL